MRIDVRKLLTFLVSAALLLAAFWYADFHDITSNFGTVRLETIIGMLALVGANLVLVTYRLYLLQRASGVAVPFWGALQANVGGLVSSLFVINLIGSLVGRYFFLRRYGVSPATVSAITIIERILLLVVGGGLFVAGVLSIFDRGKLLDIANDSNLPGIFIVVLFVLLIMTTIWSSRSESFGFRRFRRWSFFGKVSAQIGITFATQLVTLFLYFVAAKGMNVSAPTVSLFAAAAVISFAASLPIAVNGWGIRELAAVYTFGQLGVDAATALSVSILVGLVSTAIVLVSGAALVFPQRKQSDVGKLPVELKFDSSVMVQANGRTTFTETVRTSETWLALLAGLGVGLLVFFQVHTDLQGARINISLADPLAIIGVMTIALAILRRPGAALAVPRLFLLWCGLVTVVLAVGFIVGLLEFGLLEWALVNRLAGWGILLGYLGLAAALVSSWRQHGLRRLCQVMLLTGASCVLYTIVYREAFAYVDWLVAPSPNFEGFAFNRNAFAFQLLIAAGGGLAYSKVMARAGHASLWTFLLGLVFLGIWLTQSRTGIAVGLVMLAGTALFGMAGRRLIFCALGWSVGILLTLRFVPDLIELIPVIVQSLGGEFNGEVTRKTAKTGTFTAHYSFDSSLNERWLSIRLGFELWVQNPLFGGGLGSFVAKQIPAGGPGILVIHSIPIWILAEVGSIGFVLIFFIPAALIFRLRDVQFSRLPPHMVFGACGVFSLLAFGLLHDMAYQRAFWIVLGATAAAMALRVRPYARRAAKTASASLHSNQTVPEIQAARDGLALQKDPVVAHIIPSLEVGGAERMLSNYLTQCAKDRAQHIVISLTGSGGFTKLITASGIPVIEIKLKRTLPGVVLGYIRLRRVLQNVRPSVIDTWMYHGVVFGYLASLGMRTWDLRKFFVHIRCSVMDLGKYSLTLKASFYACRFLAQIADKVIYNSNAGLVQHSAVGFNTDRSTVIQNGIASDIFRFNPDCRSKTRAAWGIAHEKIVVCTVARYDPMKGYDILLEVADRLREECHFVVVGLNTDKHMPSRPNLLRLGQRDDVQNLLSACDIYCLSSTFGEGFPNALAEAMSVGLTPVAFDVGDSREIIGDTGVIAERINADALTAAVKRAIQMRREVRDFAETPARHRIVDHFELKSVVAKLDDLYAM